MTVAVKLIEAAIVIADKVVPAYRLEGKSYPCHGHVAKRWQAAYDGAFLALGGEATT